MDSQDILKRIFSIHSKKLGNLDQNNPKLLILFSGVPGSGKTTIAKKLENKYKGVRITSDDIRDTIRDYILPMRNLRKEEQEELVTIYLNYLFRKLSVTNGLIILDSSIDRKYQLILNWAEINKFDTYIISMEISRDQIEDRILKRKEKNASEYLNQLERQLNDHKNFKSIVKVDAEYREESDLYTIFSQLDNILRPQ